METNGGGWTLIQRRKVGLTSFNRDWKQYKSGFGSIRGDFWLGNDHIFRITRQPSMLRIEMEVRAGKYCTRVSARIHKPCSVRFKASREMVPIPNNNRLTLDVIQVIQHPMAGPL